MEHKIDATNKKAGRLASEIATILQGKNSPAYNPKNEGTETVRITNVSKLSFGNKKLSQKYYYRHAGQLGHLKERKLKDVMEKNPAWVLRNAIRLMLPKNRLNSKRLQRLIIEK